MPSHSSRIFSSLTGIVFSLAVVLWMLSAPPSEGRATATPTAFALENNDVIEQPSDEQQEAIRRVSDYLVGPVDRVTPVLRTIGFNPDQSPFARDWDKLPVERKVAIAFAYAREAAQQNVDGGERFLALLSRNLANTHPAARTEPALARFLKIDTLGQVPFSQPKVDVPLTQLPAEIKNAIAVIGKYAQRSTVGGSPFTYVERHTGLSRSAVFDIVVTSANYTEALERAVSSVAEGQRADVVRRMVSQIRESYQAARYERAFFPFLPNTTPATTLGAPPGSAPTPVGAPSRGTPPSPAAQRFTNAIETHFNKPELRDQRQMRSRVTGLGGVIFGASVTAKSVPEPEVIRYIPIEAGNSKKGRAAVGKFVITLKNGKTLEFPEVLAEDAYAGYHLLHTPIKGIPPHKEGEGLGIAGIGPTWNLETLPFKQSVLSFVEFGPRSKTSGNVLVDPVILHPLLIDLPLGHAAIRADATPRRYRAALYEAVSAKFGKDVGASIQDTFEVGATGRARDWSFAYLFVDVPVSLTTEGPSLLAQRTPEPDRKFPEGIARSAFLELRLITNPDADIPENRYDQELAKEFYHLLPLLAQADYNLHRMNRFVPVLAVLRWAKQHGAKHEGFPGTPEKIRTPDVILSDWDSKRFTPEQRLLIEDQLNGGTLALTRRIQSLENEAELKSQIPALKTALDKTLAGRAIAIQLFPVRDKAHSRFLVLRQTLLKDIKDLNTRRDAEYWVFENENHWMAVTRREATEANDAIKPHADVIRKATESVRVALQKHENDKRAEGEAWLELNTARAKALAGISAIEAQSDAQSWLIANGNQWRAASRLEALEGKIMLKPHLDVLRKGMDSVREALLNEEKASFVSGKAELLWNKAHAKVLEGIPVGKVRSDAQSWLRLQNDQRRIASQLQNLEAKATLKPHLEALRKSLDESRDVVRRLEIAQQGAGGVQELLHEIRAKVVASIKEVDAKNLATSLLWETESQWRAYYRTKELESRATMKPHLESLRIDLEKVHSAWLEYDKQQRDVERAFMNANATHKELMNSIKDDNLKLAARYWFQLKEEQRSTTRIVE